VVSRARRRGPWAAWLAAGVALVLGFAATWGVLAGFDAPSEEAAAVAAPAPVAAPPPAAVATTPTVTVAAPRPATPPVAARTGAPAPLVPGAASAPEPVAPPARLTPRPVIAPLPPPTPPRVAAVPPPAPRAPARTYADDDATVVTGPITGRAPRFVDDEETTASSSARAELPVDVVRTSWHPQAERRAAWVAIGNESPREVKEGEWVGAYEVRSIEPDGVLFADGPLLVHRPVGQR
jgi:hypothetical protein